MHDVTPWTMTAIVVRYDTPVAGKKLAPGCFSHSIARWLIPLMGDHAARFLSFGVACDYDDSDAALIVDFVVEEWTATQVLDGVRLQFSVQYGGYGDPADR